MTRLFPVIYSLLGFSISENGILSNTQTRKRTLLTLFPSLSRYSPLASPENALDKVTDDIHVTKCNSAPIIEHHWCSFLPERSSYLGIQESTYNFSGPFAGFPSSARPLDARAAQGSVLGTVLYLHSP